ncbi:MAG: hypothetical protein J0I32_23345 [Sphingobacteriales bacterium]|nr:hypothetical protein [Sphingobacteriales bacterium]OJW01976.1 MAG: hypothetical protein BGO52_00395 [Sphingobacteriales bacterium 44-61]
MKRIFISEIIASLFILLFVYTSINKFLSIQTVTAIFKGYPLIGGMASLIAWILPISEFTIAVLLFFPKSRKVGFAGSIILLTLFSIYLGYILLFTDKEVCTCGGLLNQLSWPQHLLLNTLLIILAITAIKLHRKEKPPLPDNQITSVVST